MSQRYARYAGTETPTVNAQLRPVALEPPTRVEGQRRPSRPAPHGAAMRPDGAAAGRSGGEGDATIEQPPFEIATTAVLVLPNPNITQRLPQPASQPPTLYGPDTWVDPPTRAPTALPAPAPERTERLLLSQCVPGQGLLTDPGPTRTSVPLAESGSNLTPPPVVPTLPSVKPARSMVPLLIAAALGGMALLGGGLLLLRPDGPATGAPSAAAPPRVASTAPPIGAPEPSASPQLQKEATPPEPSVAAPAAAASSGTPPRAASPLLSARNQEKKLPFLSMTAPPPAAPVTVAPAGPKPKASASMPSSGL